MDGAFSEALGKQLIDDENHFIGRLRIVTATPIEVIAPPAPGTALKRMSFLKRRADVTPEQFAYEWNVRHAALVKTLPGVLGYRQNLITHRESPKGNVVGYDGLPIDGIVELWFENADTFNAAFSSPQGVQTMQHAMTFIDEMPAILVEPFVLGCARRSFVELLNALCPTFRRGQRALGARPEHEGLERLRRIHSTSGYIASLLGVIAA